jgi:hypothetical protein
MLNAPVSLSVFVSGMPTILFQLEDFRLIICFLSKHRRFWYNSCRFSIGEAAADILSRAHTLVHDYGPWWENSHV